jgi:RNA polymerase sigma-70 factor (ECF subfamily)
MSTTAIKSKPTTAEKAHMQGKSEPEQTSSPAADVRAEETTTSFKRELLATLPSLRAFAVSLSGRHDKADDLVQDTVMKAWAKQTSFEMGTNLKAWLFTILRNEFYSQMRKRGREVQDTEGAFTERMAVHPSQYGVMDLADFKKALDALPDDQREAIILIGASGFSYEEAAEICKCAVGTMKSRVSRARTRLQGMLGVSGEADYGPDAVSAQVTSQARFNT